MSSSHASQTVAQNNGHLVFYLFLLDPLSKPNSLISLDTNRSRPCKFAHFYCYDDVRAGNEIDALLVNHVRLRKRKAMIGSRLFQKGESFINLTVFQNRGTRLKNLRKLVGI
jgi:hypothetical protein